MLLIIVIGVALLAFIVGDAISNSRNLFGKGTRIAKVGDNKIDLPEFQQRQKELSDLYKDQQIDGSELTSLAIEQLIDEKLLDAAADKMGIEVSDQDLGFYIYDMPLRPVQIFVVSNFGSQVSPRQAYEMIKNPQAYGISQQTAEMLQLGWTQMEKETRQAVRRHMYESLVAGTIKPSALELADMHRRSTESYNVNMAMKAFDPATLDKYQATDAEIQKLYEERKEYYKVGLPSASLGLVYMRVAPSTKDMQKAQDLSLQGAAALAKGEIPAFLTKEGVRYDKYALPLKYINADNTKVGYNTERLKEAPVDSVVSYRWSTTFVNVKKTGTYEANDSVEVAVFEVPTAKVAEFEKLVATDIAMDSVAGKLGTGVSLMGQEPITALNPALKSQMPSDILAKLQNAQAGELITFIEGDDKNPARIAKVIKAIPTTVYQFEAANYELFPSTETDNEAREKLSAFGTKHKSIEAFKKNAAAEGLQFEVYTVDATTPYLLSSDGRSSLQNTSPIVSWAIAEASKGEVSQVYDNGDARNPWLYMAVMGDEFSDYCPASDPTVKEELTALIKKQKAGADMVKQYSGKGNMEATAAAMGTTVQNVADMRFGGAPMLRDISVSARMVGTTPGAKVYVVEGENGVYAYQVASKNENPTKANDEQNTNVYYMIYNGLDNLRSQAAQPYQAIGKLLRGSKEIENNRYELMGN